MLVIGPSTGVLEIAEKTRRAFSHLRPSLLPSDTGIENSTLSWNKIVRGGEGRCVMRLCTVGLYMGRVCWVSGE